MARSGKKKEKIRFDKKIVSCIAIVAFVIVSGIANLTGLITYDELMVLLGLNEHVVSGAELSVHFIDVGQGDSILVISGDKTVLIDAGEKEYGETVAKYIKSQNISELDYVIATHPHSDHIGGLAYVISEFDVSNIILPKIPKKKTPTTVVYTSLLEAVKKKGLLLTAAVPGDSYDLGISELKIMGPCSDDYDDLNDYSVVTELIHGSNKFLFTGDAEKKCEKDMLKENMLEDIDVLKAGHHGSSSSSCREFLDVVKPEYAVIMCGVGNSYNHPSESTMNSLSEMTERIFRTDMQGSIIALSDGKDIDFKVTGKE